ncbi:MULTISPECIES: minor capsid protein, partial [unclassified Lactobacillus]|uniref:minor capsid protein n=1 Tax=unclassified Lactobacillus TaxID=2620435 RepID=UPI0011C3BE1C
MMTKTNRSHDYWQKRFLQEKNNQLSNTAEYESAMRARLKEVEQVLEQEVDYWLKRYANNQEVSHEDARKILSTIGTRDWHMTLKEFKRKAKESGFDKELDAEYFKSQLSRLENIDEQLTNLLSQYATAESDKLAQSLSNQFQQTYMHSIYLTQLEQAKLSSNFANVNEYQVKVIVNKPWNGSNFSKRIWKNYTEMLPNELGDALLRGTVLGHSHQQVFKMMRQRLRDVEDYQLHRLVITEMGHIAEEATAQAYKEECVEKYQYLATLESHTCEECGHLDGKIFDLKDKKDGVNYPLIHPYCRCTTMPYMEGLTNSKERWARNPETGKGYYVDDMDFQTWKNAIDYQRKAQTIPNNATRYIKTGKFDWNELNAEQYNKHVKGTPEFDNYAKGRKRPVSELIISPVETQALI